MRTAIFFLVNLLSWTILNAKDRVVVPDDTDSLLEAYQMVSDEGTIVIKPGTYKLPNGMIINRTVTFIGDSQNPEDVIVECDTTSTFFIIGGKSSFQNITSVCKAPEAKNGVYSAFSVQRGGSALFKNCIATSHLGNGFGIADDNTNVKIESCIMKNSKYSGIVTESSGIADIENCDFTNNSTGICMFSESSATITNCHIHENKGCGIYMEEKSNSFISRCNIANNSKGIVVKTSANPNVVDCRIHANKYVGIYCFIEAFGKFQICNIYGNEGPGVYITKYSKPSFAECKIFNGKSFGVLIDGKTEGVFNQCDIYNNHKAGIVVTEKGNPVVTDCNIHDNKTWGIFIDKNGQGVFNDNKLKDNKLGEWKISDEAGNIAGTNNMPPKP